MVVPNTFDFYSHGPTRPMTSESKQHFAAPSYSSSTADKNLATASEIPLDDLPPEKPIVKTATEPVRRSQELARPKRKAKPRPFDRFIRTCADQSLLVKGVIIALVSSIPFVVFMIVAFVAFPPGTLVGPANLKNAHPTTLRKLAVWLMACWASFVGLLYLGRIVAVGVAWLCTMSTAANRFRGLAREACLRMTLFLWAAVGYAIVPSIFFAANDDTPEVKKAVADWVAKMHKAFTFLMIAFAIILVQGVILMLIKIQYIEGFIGPRAEKAENELQVLKEVNHLVNPHVSSDDISFVAKVLKKLLLPTNSRDPYLIIARGEGDEDVWNEYAANVWATIANGKSYLTAQDLSQQLLAMNRDPERGGDLFIQLDESLDGQITEDEVTKLVHTIGLQLNKRTQAMVGIRRLMQKLEIVLSILMLILIVFVYVQFFEKDLEKNIGSLWGGVVGLSFAFSGAVSEFVNSAVFCFGKHPYDVGDYVEVKGKKFIVRWIFLTHTNFEQVQNEHVRGLFVQMSHASLLTEPIINWTRTVEEAAKRHSNVESDDFKRTCERNENAAALVVSKLEHLKMVDGVSKQE